MKLTDEFKIMKDSPKSKFLARLRGGFQYTGAIYYIHKYITAFIFPPFQY